MKRIIYLSLPALAVLLSGCGSVSQPAAQSVVENVLQPPQGFSQQVQKGSIWKSADEGRSFSVKSTVNEQSLIEKADILTIAFHPTKPGTIVVGSAENGIFRTENGGDSWAPIEFPPQRIYSFILDRRDPDNRMFASGIIDNRGKIFRSDDGGANWMPIYTEPGVKTVISSLAQDPRNPDVLYAGTSAGTLVKSIDAGATWTNIGNSVDGVISEIYFDPTDSRKVYLLNFKKSIRFTQDGGTTWVDWDAQKAAEIKELNAKSSALQKAGNTAEAARVRASASDLQAKSRQNPIANKVLSLVTDGSKSGTIYAGTPSGLFRSTDYGKNWVQLNIIESAMKFPIRAIAVNPKNSNEIVFVSGNAFYRSEDAGSSWAVIPLATDRPPAVIEFDPFDSRFMFLGLRKM
ncbi:MAG: hypothetical protein HGA31_03150 [Candidatus Moranbacteria bacterium]|nr:hypothetical protein [Candidatus Moranbacteria bacterium]